MAHYNRKMHDVVVYPRRDCDLCDVVKETLSNAQGEADFQWHEVDVDAYPELRQKHNDEVPVVFVDGRKASKYRMGMPDFLRLVAGCCRFRQDSGGRGWKVDPE